MSGEKTLEQALAENYELQERLYAAARRMEEFRVLFEGDALTYLRSVYNNQCLEQSERLKAAELALPYEKPKLSANLSPTSRHIDGLGERLETARKASGLRVIEGPRPGPGAEGPPPKDAA
jgi:hypothetical protein